MSRPLEPNLLPGNLPDQPRPSSSGEYESLVVRPEITNQKTGNRVQKKFSPLRGVIRTHITYYVNVFLVITVSPVMMPSCSFKFGP